MKTLISISLIFSSWASFAQLKPMSYKEAEAKISSLTTEISTALATQPKDYTFYNDAGENTVNYIGQNMRQLLISDSKGEFGSFTYGNFTYNEVYDRLSAFYNFNQSVHGPEEFSVKGFDEDVNEVFFAEGEYYEEIFPRDINLTKKIAGNDSHGLRRKQILGWETADIQGIKVDRDGDGFVMPGELYETMMMVIATNASGKAKSFTVKNPGQSDITINRAHITPNGLDLAQMAQKLLHGALSFAQAAGDYTAVDLKPGKGLTADNTAALGPQKPYTVLQHHWDEAFGYFGAARNYADYKDTDIYRCITSGGEKKCFGLSIDGYTSTKVKDPSNGEFLFHQATPGGDDEISLISEKNLGMSVNAAKRDIQSGGVEDFTKNIFEAFVAGRHLIQEQPKDYLVYAQAYAVKAMHEWERLLAATVVHYINKTAKDYEKLGTTEFDFEDLAKHFGELKGFAFAFQFNPNSVMFEGSTPDAKFIKLHQLIGDKTAHSSLAEAQAHSKELIEARDMLVEVYSFDKKVAEEW